MSPYPLIDAYLRELRAALPLRRRARERILDEARDHLLSAVEAAVDEGAGSAAAEQAALRRFGGAQHVALSHVRPRAHAATVRLAGASTLTAAAFGALFVLTTQVAAVRVGAPATAVRSGLAGACGWVAVQLVAVTAGLTLLRCVRLRATPGAGSGSLRLAVRSAATVSAAIGASLVLDVAAFTRMPAGQGQHAALVFGLVLAAGAGTTLLLAQVVAARRRLGALERLAAEPAAGDALDDVRWALQAVTGALGTAVPSAARLARGTGVAAARLLGADAPATRRLRARPWRSAVAAAALTGLAAGVAHLLAEGPPTRGPLVALLVLALVAAAEATAMLGCYLVLGRYLGLTRR